MFVQLILYFLVFTVYISTDVQAETSLSGSSDFGVEGRSFSMICNINDSFPGSHLVDFRRDDNMACKLYVHGYRSIRDCLPLEYINRYNCACIKQNTTYYSFALNITDVHRSDGGNWTCGSMYELTSSNVLDLHVHYPPEITNITVDPMKDETDEGSRVTFTCLVDSVPPSNITWSTSRAADGVQGSIFTIPVATCQHTDNYTCTATNGIGHPVSKATPLYVRCSPRIDPNETINGTVTASLGESVHLFVKVLAHPSPTFTWKYLLGDRKERAITNWRITTIHSDLTSILTIKDVINDDYGDYVVYVSNDVGRQSMVFTLNPTPDVAEQITDSDDGFGKGVAVGIVICVVIVAVIAAVVWFIRKRRTKGTDAKAGGALSNMTYIHEEDINSNRAGRRKNKSDRQNIEVQTPSAAAVAPENRIEPTSPSYESLSIPDKQAHTYEEFQIYENQSRT